MTRDEVIKDLIQNDINIFSSCASQDDYNTLHFILMNGWEGYKNMSDVRLERLYNTSFDRKPENTHHKPIKIEQ